MGTYETRLARARDILNEKSIDVLLLTDGYNIHYVTGYAGHEGMALIFNDQAVVLTDSRYTEAAAKEAPCFTVVDIKSEGYGKTIRRILAQAGVREDASIGFEDRQISYRQMKRLSEDLSERTVWVEIGDAAEHLRYLKDPEEIECLARAEAIGDEAFAHILTVLKPGMTEREVALALEVSMRERGASGLSFDTIAASGENSSMPHAVPTDRVLSEGDFLTMDFGCIYRGYCSDMTRTVLIGKEREAEQIRVYETVLRAQKAALAAIRPGAMTHEVDKIARDIIADAGYGDCFGHGLGHSVGLFIHEEPRLSPKCEKELEPGIVITCEPGIYLPERFGVRIEDMVVVTEDGYRNLAGSPKELIRV